MATLTAQQIDEVLADLMGKYSQVRQEIPVTRVQFETWLTDTIDPALENAEAAIYADTPAGTAKDWLTANQSVGRDVIIAIEAKRREVL